jgi:DNA-binding transcriptional regulator YhcF (GntR family)
MFIDELTRKIKESISSEYRGTLAGTDSLAARYKVSRKAIRKALHILSQQGIISLSQGRRAVILRDGAQSVPSDELGESAYEIYIRIKQDITDGSLRTGTPLPSFKYYTSNHAVAPTTIQHALKALVTEGLIHKSGKRWIIGPACTDTTRRASALVAASGAPLVFLFYPDIHSLLTTRSRMRLSFFTDVLHELEKSHIRTMPMFVKSSFTDETLFQNFFAHHFEQFPIGIDAIIARFRKLGSQYYGTLVPFLFTEMPIADFLDTIGELLALNKPVVIIDNSYPTEDARVFKMEEFIRNHPAETRNLFFFYNNDLVPARLAIESLTKLGHRKIGLLRNYDLRWAHARIALLRESARRSGAEVFMAEEILDPADFNEQVLLEKISESAKLFDGEGADFSYKRIRRDLSLRKSLEMIHTNRALDYLILKSGVTALVTLNDSANLYYYFFLAFSNFQVPRNLSMISFDNNPFNWSYPVSTIDFKYDLQAYRAAHILIGDIPMRAGRITALQEQALLIDRGSLGPPRTGKLDLELLEESSRL